MVEARRGEAGRPVAPTSGGPRPLPRWKVWVGFGICCLGNGLAVNGWDCVFVLLHMLHILLRVVWTECVDYAMQAGQGQVVDGRLCCDV